MGAGQLGAGAGAGPAARKNSGEVGYPTKTKQLAISDSITYLRMRGKH